MKRANTNHKSDQANPNNPAHRHVNDNRSNQGNTNNQVFYQTRNLPVPVKK